ncbi:MAG: Gfo/Idh/MocA family oxidoreductase [Candidatus Methylacidiphilales bacterium]
MKKTKTGVIGVGHMGREHARIYSTLAGSEFVGIYDTQPAQARKIAQQYGCTAFDSLADFLRTVEAATIAAPTSEHYRLAQLCLDAGIHVLVEKPLTPTTKEALELVELAGRRGAVLQVGHIERFNPVLKALEDRLTRPRFIEAHRLSPYPGRSLDIGVVMDLMIHDIEIILHLVRSPLATVDAVGVRVLSQSEDIANARLRFENGCVANITTSRISPEKMRKIRVFQDDAYLSLDYQNQEGQIYRKGPFGISRDSIEVMKGEPLKNQLESFIDCVQRRSDPVVSGLHAAEALRVAALVCEQIGDLSAP